MENLEFYKTKNLDSREAEFVKKLLGRLSDQLVDFEAKIDSLKKSAHTFSETLQDHVNMTMERADIITKYYYDDQYQPHNPLPGIVSTPSPLNIAEVKEDNKKIEELVDLLKKVEDQKNITQKMMQDDFEDLTESFTRTMTLCQGLAEGLVSITSAIDL